MQKRKLQKNDAISWRQKSITQRDLAQWLGISLSLLSMHDKGLRYLPSKASLKLAELQKEYLKAQNSKTMSRSLQALQPAFEEHHDKVAEKMLQKAGDHRYRTARLKNSLKEITEKQDQDKIWLHTLEQKLETLAGNQASEFDSKWLDLQRNIISQRLKRSNKEQLSLELKIELLEAAADVHEAYHAKLKKGIKA